MEDVSNYFIREIELESCNQTLTLYQQILGCVNCVVWDAAIVLVKYLDLTNKNNNWLKGKTILELGAGLGCAGITAACFGANVILTDLKTSLPLLEKNIRANKNQWMSGGGSAKAQVLDWSLKNPLDLQPDIVLVADCIYYDESLENLLQLFGNFCKHEDTFIILSQEERDTPRQVLVWNKFMSELNKNFKVVHIPLSEQHPVYSSPDIHLIKVSKLQ